MNVVPTGKRDEEKKESLDDLCAPIKANDLVTDEATKQASG